MYLPSFRRTFSLFAIVVALLSPSPLHAAILWYNGDYDNRDSLTNQASVPINTGSGFAIQNSLVYDNFVVPTGQSWVVSSVFSDNQIAYHSAVTTATWQIRRGVSAGNGGVLVASGDTSATQTALTPVPGYYYGDPEFRITASVPNIVLTAGTYWLAVAPDSAGFFGDQSYVETTGGLHATGGSAGNDGNSFITNTYPTSGPASYNFTPSTVALAGNGDGPTIDFSMGVSGAVVPEPSSMSLVAVGLIGISAWVRRRTNRHHD